MKKLFDNGELGAAEKTEDDLVLPRFLLLPTRTRKSTPANTTILSLRKPLQGVENFEVNQRPPGSLRATKNHLEDCEDESDAKIFSVVLVDNNFGTRCLYNVSHGDQSFTKYVYNCNMQVHNFYSTL